MNMLELLNPMCESQDWDRGQQHHQPPSVGTDEAAAAATAGAEAAAMSLMLLGQDEKASSAEKTAPVVTPLSVATLYFSNLHIAAAGLSAEDAHTSTKGLRTPLPAAAASLHHPSDPTSTGIVSSASTSFPVAPSCAPHLSPVADKLQHIGSWSPLDAEMGIHAQQPHPSPHLQRFEQSKRPRYERLPSKIEDLFSESHAQQPHTVAEDADSCTDQAIVIDTRHDEHGEHNRREDSCTLITSTTSDHYCAVTGCLRVAQHMEKCAVHKGMKLCCMSGCFRPVQSRGFCKSHGGGARCKHPGCKKGAISKGRCRTHGGGTRCAIPNCSKWAQRFGCCVRHSKAFAASAAASAIAREQSV